MLKEFANPAAVAMPASGSMTDHILDNAAQAPNTVVLSVKRGGEWVGVTSTQFLDEVKAVAKGIIANGVAPGERIAVMSRNRYEWTVVDYAIWYAGAASVPVYETSSAEQVQWILSDSGSVAVFLESHRHKAVYDEVAVDIPSCTRVWVFDDGIIDELKREGASVSDDELEARRRSLTPDSLATLIYTSGTTGRPKGCMLTQGNLMFEVDNVVVALNEVFRAPGSSTLLFLPIAHVFGRLIQLGCLRARARLGHAADIKDLLPLLGEFQPTFLLAVPRVFEKIYNSASQKANADGKGNIFETAANTAIEYSKAKRAGRVGLGLKIKHALFDRLVYGKLRAAMGGQVRWAVSGGAPLGARLGHFFDGINVTVLEGTASPRRARRRPSTAPMPCGSGLWASPSPGPG